MAGARDLACVQNLYQQGCWRARGDELTLRAIADCYGMVVNVLTSDQRHWHMRYKPKELQLKLEIWLAYIAPVHYNSIRCIPVEKLLVWGGGGVFQALVPAPQAKELQVRLRSCLAYDVPAHHNTPCTHTLICPCKLSRQGACQPGACIVPTYMPSSRGSVCPASVLGLKHPERDSCMPPVRNVTHFHATCVQLALPPPPNALRITATVLIARLDNWSAEAGWETFKPLPSLVSPDLVSAALLTPSPPAAGGRLA